MAKQSRKPSAPAAKAKAATLKTTAAQPAHFEIPAIIGNTRVLGWLLFGFAFLLYANTLTHGFVLDDDIVIRDNMFTQKGASGISGILSKDTFFGYFKVEGKDALVSGGRYRPLTLVFFALIYQIFGANTFVYHLFTVLLFAATTVLLYRVLLLLLQPRGANWSAAMAFLATVLFAAHPIHTEVVANIKGCDEIVTLLGSLGALWLVLKAFDTGKTMYAALSGVVFFLACLSKENAATFVVVIPLALWFFRSASIEQVIKASAPVWIGFLVFFLVRGSILGWKFGGAPMELMNNPYLKIVGNNWVAADAGEKLATIIYTLGKYIMLLFVPHPLTHDYYPRHIALMNFSNPLVLLSLAVYAGLIWYALSGISKKDPVRFGILYFILTLSIVSNLVFPIGTNMGERFAFMPSIGFCLIIASGLTYWWQKGNNSLVYGILGAILVLFSFKTLTRNPVWASNERIFLTDVKVSGNSAKIRNACGGVLLDKAAKEKDPTLIQTMCEQSVLHLNKAIEIYPNYKDAYISRAGSNFLLKKYPEAVADYRMAVKLGNDDPKYKSLLAMALREAGKAQGEIYNDALGALKYLNEAWTTNPKDPETARLLGVANGVTRNNNEALSWFQRAVDLEPGNANYIFDLGTAYFFMGNPAKADELHQKAIQMDPKLQEKLAQGRQ
ncbi:MAG: glycosyltransferase family 39 protein [Saprospiraceae bacterium]|nr:glycosyltransferase family 39 protein [Saprospiraceae bacterium]